MPLHRYDLLSANDHSPFGRTPPGVGPERGLTFHIGTPRGESYDQVLFAGGAGAKSKREIGWLWPGRVPLGRVTLVEGPAGVGKSLVTLDLAARLSDERPWPDGAPQSHPGSKTLIVCRQDHADDVAGARLDGLGARRERIIQFHEFETLTDRDVCGVRFLSLPFDVPALDAMLRHDSAIRLLVIDSLSDFCKGKGDLAEALHLLNRLAAERNVAVIVTLRSEVRFDRQGQLVNRSRFETGAARCQWCCAADPHDPTRRLLLPTLLNYAVFPTGMAFRPGDRQLDWLESGIDPRDPVRDLSACAQWLRELLEEGERHSKQVIQLGHEYGYSEGQLHRAFHEIGTTRGRDGYSEGSMVMWALDGHLRPASGERPARRAHEPQVDAADGYNWVPVFVKPAEALGKKRELADPRGAEDAGKVASPQKARNESAADVPVADVSGNPRSTAPVSPPTAPFPLRPGDMIPWADSPSARLAPLNALLDGPHNPNQLRRNVKSMKSTAKAATPSR